MHFHRVSICVCVCVCLCTTKEIYWKVRLASSHSVLRLFHTLSWLFRYFFERNYSARHKYRRKIYCVLLQWNAEGNKNTKYFSIFRSLLHSHIFCSLFFCFSLLFFNTHRRENIECLLFANRRCLHGLCASVRLQSRQLQNACNKKKIHKMVKMESEPDKKLELKKGLMMRIQICLCTIAIMYVKKRRASEHLLVHNASQHHKCCLYWILWRMVK